MGNPQGDKHDLQTAGPAPPLVPDEELPPAYRQEREDDPDELVSPSSFILRGLFVYPLATASSSTSPSSTSENPPNTTNTTATEGHPVYQLSRAIHTLGGATESIDFQRITYCHGRDPTTVTKRIRDLYTLNHRPPLLSMTWEASMTPCAAARRTVGKVRIQKSPLFHHGYRAVPLVPAGEEERGRAGEKDKDKGKGSEKEYHFLIREQSKDLLWEWTDQEGMVVARQAAEKVGKGHGDGDAGIEYKLHLLAPLQRRMLDSLVAMWCLWMWHIHWDRTVTRKTWADRE